jgi:hypothetical protein
MLKYSDASKKMDSVFWQTTDLVEEEEPNSNLKIKYNRNEIESYGCGDSVNAVFNISNNDSEIWFRTELIEISTGIKTIMYLTEMDNKLHVGKGMCGGPFKYNDNKKYKICFTPTNSDGRTLERTKWFEFKSPYDTENYFMKRK